MLGDVELLKLEGNVILGAFIDALEAQKTSKLVARNINPETMRFNEDFDQCMLGDMTRALPENTEIPLLGMLSPPYSSEHYAVFESFKHSSRARDDWSFGMLILEMLGGSMLMSCFKEYLDIYNLYLAFKPLLDLGFQSLLEWLMFTGEAVDYKAWKEDHLNNNEHFVEDNITRVRAAKISPEWHHIAVPMIYYEDSNVPDSEEAAEENEEERLESA